MSVRGVAAAASFLNRYRAAMERAAKAGVIEAATILKSKAADKNAPRDTGNLAGSAMVVADGIAAPSFSFSAGSGKSGRKVDVQALRASAREVLAKSNSLVRMARSQAFAVVAFGANYAAYVHELHKERGKFLSRAIRSEKGRMDRAMEKYLKAAHRRTVGSARALRSII